MTSIVILGLSITSSWGNGHATTYRGLVRELSRLGHEVLFLERDVPWYAMHRDLPDPPYGRTCLYHDLAELQQDYAAFVRKADCVIVGSYVSDGVAVGRWVQETATGVTAFYDIDTPVTLTRLSRGDEEYLSADLIPGFDLYLSFTGGPTLDLLEKRYGAPRARALYCSVDPDLHYPSVQPIRWDVGYIGTYSEDRQPGLAELMLKPATAMPSRRFVVAGPQYPVHISWPVNVERIEHLPPGRHRSFYSAQRFTLNLTRADMVAAGWSPSVRLFEAAACGVPVISDSWPGLECLFVPGEEILIARSSDDVCRYLVEFPDDRRRAIAAAARRRVLSAHTAAHRAAELLGFIAEVGKRPLTASPSSVLQPAEA